MSPDETKGRKVVPLFPPTEELTAKAQAAVEDSIRELPTEYLTLALKVAADELARRMKESE